MAAIDSTSPSRPDDGAAEREPLCRLVAALGETLGDEMERRMAARGYPDITQTHGKNVFRVLDEDGTRLTELAARARMTKQAIGELVDQLEAMGYVERRPDPVDRRAKIVVPTAAGRKAQATARECLLEIDAEWAQQIGPERMGLLEEAMRELVGAG
jgi:DNA-binding MarR family transcriptional regulator